MLRREVLSLTVALAFLLPTGKVAAQGTPDAAAAAEEKTEEIVVTGSRIRRKDLTTPAPVTVISRDQIVQSGKVSIGDFLQSLPEQGNAINTSVNNGGDGATRVSLRSLGATRTLVLINGRRVVAGGTGADATVDLNSIPSAAIENIEILKDGASAVYGSDAVAGVVNLITKKRFDGSDVSAFYGTSSRSDAQITDLSWTSGTASEKGSLLFTVGYYDQKESWAGDRDFSKQDKLYNFTDAPVFGFAPGVNPLGSSANPNSIFTPSAAWFNATCPTAPATGPIAQACAAWTASGSRSLTYDQATGTYITYSGVIHAYNYQPENYLVTPSKRVSVFATGDTNLANLGRGYFEASYVNRRSEQRIAPVPLSVANFGRISASSIYNPLGVDLVSVRRRLLEAGNRFEDQDLDTFRVVTGVDGSLGDWAGPLQGWTWDLSYNFGRTQGVDTKNGALRTNLVSQAMGPSMDPDNSLALTGTVSGDEICVTTPGNAATRIPGCVPLNILWAYGLPADGDAIRSLTFRGPNRGYNQMKSVNANVTGELVPLMAEEPVSLAIGAEYREEAGGDIVNPINEAGLGSDYNKQSTEGRFFAKEAYAELLVPVVANMPGAAKVELNAAARYTSYNTFGDKTSFKVGGTWAPVNDVTIRGTYSTAFRSPTIGNLFGGTIESFPSVTDPCAAPTDPVIIAQCGAAANNGDSNVQLRTNIGGNVNLQPETAKIFTIGAVVQPRMLPNFSATLDYYNVEVEDAISSIGASVILSSCYSGVAGQQSYCNKITREQTTQTVSFIDDTLTNVGSTTVSGIDLALRYQLPTNFGRFGFVFDGTYLLKYDEVKPDGQLIESAGNYDLSLVLPRIKFNTGVNWGMKGFGAGLSAKFIGPSEECADSDGLSFGGVCSIDATYKRDVETYVTFDGFASYTLDSGIGNTTFTLGMLNMLDREPAVIYNGFLAASDPTAYDFTGRYVYARLQQRF